jgi:Bax protein
MLPQRRRPGATHSLKPFRDLMDATRSYARNLNTHRAYEGFRDMRAKMLAAGNALDGAALAATLTRYSERGGDYVAAVRNLIRSNNLAALDGATFNEKIHLTQMARNDRPRDSES